MYVYLSYPGERMLFLYDVFLVDIRCSHNFARILITQPCRPCLLFELPCSKIQNVSIYIIIYKLIILYFCWRIFIHTACSLFFSWVITSDFRDYISDLLDAEKKFLLFAHHQELLDALEDVIKQKAGITMQHIPN